MAHNNLGVTLKAQGKQDEATAEYRLAIRLKPDNAEAHNNLGVSLNDQGKLDEAIAECRRPSGSNPSTLRPTTTSAPPCGPRVSWMKRPPSTARPSGSNPSTLRPTTTSALALRAQGKYQETLAAYHGAAELAPEGSAVAKEALVRIRETERMIALDARLPAILKGTDHPKDTTERLAFAQMAYDRAFHSGAARLWAEALTADPKLGDDREVQHRYNAACAAALAGCGEGKDDPAPDDGAKARLRRQALDWLKDELSAWSKALESSPPQNRTVIGQTLDHWRQDRDLAGVREPAAPDRLPETERADWQKLWSEVEAAACQGRRLRTLTCAVGVNLWVPGSMPIKSSKTSRMSGRSRQRRSTALRGEDNYSQGVSSLSDPDSEVTCREAGCFISSNNLSLFGKGLLPAPGCGRRPAHRQRRRTGNRGRGDV